MDFGSFVCGDGPLDSDIWAKNFAFPQETYLFTV